VINKTALKKIFKSKNSRGFLIIESIIALAMIVIIGLGVSYYVSNSKNTGRNLASSGQCQAITTNILGSITAADNSLVITNNAPMSSNAEEAVQPSSLERDNPLCCTESNRANCSAQRRSVLCGHYTSAISESQNVKGAATWAQNFYLHCLTTGSAGCGLTNQSSGSLCSGEGLDFDDASELALLGQLLPNSINLGASADSYGRPPLGTRPSRVQIKIEPISLNRRNISGGCDAASNGLESNPPYGLNSSMGYNVEIISHYATNPSVAVAEQNPIKTCPAITADVVMASDYTQPSMTYTTGLQNSGGNLQVSAIEGASENGDNQGFGTGNVFYQDGSLRANTSCTCPVTLGTPPGSGSTYCTGWEKVGLYAVSSEPGSTFMCSPSVTNTPDRSCDTVFNGVISDNTQSSDQGTRIGVAWNTPMPEGTQISVAVADAGGNRSPQVAQFTVSPGYCPPTQSYCADGSQTGPESGPLVTAGTGSTAACAQTATWPASDPAISCRPHSGCGSAAGNFCIAGTRQFVNYSNAMNAASCPAANTYCTVGVNKGPYTCAGGVDCTIDNRCAQPVCDDCGHATCPASTIPLGNNCPATSNYCPNAVVGGSGTMSLPTDTCGNACPPGTLAPGSGCPNTGNYCPNANASGSGVMKLPSDACGNLCPPGNISYNGAGCPSIVKDPNTCGVAALFDGCGRQCPVTETCSVEPVGTTGSSTGDPDPTTTGFDCNSTPDEPGCQGGVTSTSGSDTTGDTTPPPPPNPTSGSSSGVVDPPPGGGCSYESCLQNPNICIEKAEQESCDPTDPTADGDIMQYTCKPLADNPDCGTCEGERIGGCHGW